MDSLERLFPPCTDPKCTRRGPHADILPHQRELLESSEKFVALLGGYGAGKTLPASILGVLLSLQVPGNRGIVVRRSYPKLHDSVMRVYFEVLQRIGATWKPFETRDGWSHRIVLPNDSEISFRETKDLGRFLGPEYGWFHIEEAAEEPRKTFTDLVGRLRHGPARRFLRGFITSNPPHHQHWLADIFGTQPGVSVKTLRDSGRTISTSYRLIRVSSRSNPYLPESYVADLMANNPPSEVARIIDGEFGFVWDGKPVYGGEFRIDTHVRTLEPIAGMSVVRSWDFGYHCPAVTWHQFPKCVADRVHWLILHEYVGQNLEAEDLGNMVIAETKARFGAANPQIIVDCGDAAGAQVSDKGPGPIIRLMKEPWRMRFKYRHIPNVDPGIALVRTVLGEAQCKCGQPTVQVSRSCRHTIDGFAGGYHYPQLRPGRASTDQALKPFKDGFYDNVMDTVRYAAENHLRSLRLDPRLVDIVLSDGEPAVAPSPGTGDWRWMVVGEDARARARDLARLGGR